MTGAADAPRPAVYNLAVGQVAEFSIWTRLIASSGGDLHVFLPLEDRGIDAIVHRISTDTYCPLQVKGHTVHPLHGIALQVTAGELVDDRAVVVGVDVAMAQASVGTLALAVPAPTFRELAQRNVTRGGEVLYEAQMSLPPPPGSPWAPWCVALETLGERLLPRAAVPALPPVMVPAEWFAARRRGFRAEMEVLRRAADADALNVFKAFPDLEPNEYLAYHVETRRITGVQVKALSFRPGATEAQVSVYRPALRPSPRTWFVILLADQGATAFLPDCLVIPSTVVAQELAGQTGDEGRLWVTRAVTGRLAPWRVELARLGERLATLPVVDAVD